MSSLPTVTPMAPTLAKPFHRPGWVYEEKYDGWRLIALGGRPLKRKSHGGLQHSAGAVERPKTNPNRAPLSAPTNGEGDERRTRSIRR